MRKKTVSFDDDTRFTISPLNLNQVDDYVRELPESATAAEAQARSLEVICTSLNNASPDTPWTPQRCREELDLPVMKFLFNEILKLSGLTLEHGEPFAPERANV